MSTESFQSDYTDHQCYDIPLDQVGIFDDILPLPSSDPHEPQPHNLLFVQNMNYVPPLTSAPVVHS